MVLLRNLRKYICYFKVFLVIFFEASIPPLRCIGAKARRIVLTSRPRIIKPFVPHICTRLQIPHGTTYFEYLADTTTPPAPPVPSTKSLTISYDNPGEGVLSSPGIPECPCDVISDVNSSQCQGHTISS